MALYSNTTCHMSMLVIFTLVPIVVEDGLGYSPLVVMLVLLPHQTFGLWVPAIAGYIYDKYNPRWMGPMSLFLIASGVGLLGLFANQVPIWGVPLLLLPASVGTALFISPYNAVVMNTLPDNRSFASGMLETTRQMGHTVGSTLGAAILGPEPAVGRRVYDCRRSPAFLPTGVPDCRAVRGLDYCFRWHRLHLPAGARNSPGRSGSHGRAFTPTRRG